eukprot:TRINITY_DN1777_c0_g2_i2.p1 TRINITY_DN1777_c0_g2~~TRINITY_DN1777_c0_g2_i2.p1  ORF type:complete len:291 (-),score=42.85 TRINITY_DN1777_c0_g2_i2:233-1105(-)
MVTPSPMSVCAVKGSSDGYHVLAERGREITMAASIMVFSQSIYAGCYLGFGALLATKISGSLPGLTEDNPGLEDFVFAALFPVNLLLILQSGGILYTGAAAACPAALYEGKSKVLGVLRCLVLSWIGNCSGAFAFAIFTKYCKLLEGPTALKAVRILEKKTSFDFLTTFLKGIGCNWMVCMAVLLAGQAQDMSGKYLAIWFPISTFVMIGFEHVPANLYLCTIGLMAGSDNVSFWDVLCKNWVPVTLGNFVGGGIMVAGGYSFFYGRLGEALRTKAASANLANEALLREV